MAREIDQAEHSVVTRPNYVGDSFQSLQQFSLDIESLLHRLLHC